MITIVSEINFISSFLEEEELIDFQIKYYFCYAKCSIRTIEN